MNKFTKFYRDETRKGFEKVTSGIVKYVTIILNRVSWIKPTKNLESDKSNCTLDELNHIIVESNR